MNKCFLTRCPRAAQLSSSVVLPPFVQLAILAGINGLGFGHRLVRLSVHAVEPGAPFKALFWPWVGIFIRTTGLWLLQPQNRAQALLERGTLEVIFVKQMGYLGHPPHIHRLGD
jgi:hypothetical protein